MQEVPGDVLHNSSVACEDGLGIHNLSLFGNCANVPKTDSLQEEAKFYFLIIPSNKLNLGYMSTSCSIHGHQKH